MSMISSLIDELRKSADEWNGSNMFELAHMCNEAADTIWQLRDDLQRANDAVQDAEHDESMAWDRVRKAEAENAKLRELVRDLYCLAYPSTVEWEVSDATYDKYSPCEKCQELYGGKSPCASTAKDMTEECCAPIQANVVADRMRELGVEVDG